MGARITGRSFHVSRSSIFAYIHVLLMEGHAMSHSGMSRTVLRLYKDWLSKDRERATKGCEPSDYPPPSDVDQSEPVEKSESEESN